MPSSAPKQFRDSKTPDDVVVRMEARAPLADPALGTKVETTKQGTPKNRLVAIGDSLTQGFQSGAIFNTSWSYPAMIARRLGCFDEFRYPTYNGYGGLPVNIEYLVREMEEAFGSSVNWFEAPLAVFRLRHLMDKIEDWWERGGGSHAPKTSGINHNLAVYGWDLRDALDLTADACSNRLKTPKDNPLLQIVEDANDRAAIRVLESARDAAGKAFTSFQAAKALGAQGTVEAARDAQDKGDGIETLLVALGANNALGAVVQLKVSWSGPGFDDVSQKANYTVWRPMDFASEFDKIVAEVKDIRARHVVFTTVPHVTIAPIARGVGTKARAGSRYFPYYTRPWIADEQFNPSEDPHITENEARAIDSAIDQYNEHIVSRVERARKDGKDWYVLDLAGMLDRLANRRYVEDEAARPAWWAPYQLPPELEALKPVPDSRFFASDATGRVQGGLFSLDGVHPTTAAYGLVAQEAIDVMQRAGVRFPGAPNGNAHIDFAGLIARDTLLSSPPASVGADMGTIGWLDETLDVIKRAL